MNKYIVEKAGGTQVQLCIKCYNEFPIHLNLNNGICNDCYKILQNDELLTQAKKNSDENKRISTILIILTVIIGSAEILLFIENIVQITNQTIQEIIGFIETINPALIIGLIIIFLIYLNNKEK
ncbi:hypothetical protein HOK51_04670 [Candidatus Woesearchaeota archaeon]|jgi:H+/gluconate symporter-like permease|nr:hypothetical protein [Candidatus Woesearchaeota archaeon]MBT6519118.1 hypothetical protein [Candidatus Woesearchaeota archaeon]